MSNKNEYPLLISEPVLGQMYNTGDGTLVRCTAGGTCAHCYYMDVENLENGSCRNQSIICSRFARRDSTSIHLKEVCPAKEKEVEPTQNPSPVLFTERIEPKIISVEKGWGEGSLFFSTAVTVKGKYWVDKIKQYLKPIQPGVNMLVYRGFRNGELYFEMGVDKDVTVVFETKQ